MSCPLEHTNALFGKYSFTLAVLLPASRLARREKSERQTGRHVRWCALLLFRYQIFDDNVPCTHFSQPLLFIAARMESQAK